MRVQFAGGKSGEVAEVAAAGRGEPKHRGQTNWKTWAAAHYLRVITTRGRQRGCTASAEAHPSSSADAGARPESPLAPSGHHEVHTMHWSTKAQYQVCHDSDEKWRLGEKRHRLGRSASPRGGPVIECGVNGQRPENMNGKAWPARAPAAITSW
mmetsp:Transcript_20990/g.64171  ORF Transcript_20990/g.64171 Transcript_20990/m.64171 type:complete len:154 (+) Transcript_20990:197-658(+)|eukprot:scaffold248696_cov33-Tisochrysis_lutea.AAC.1